MLDILLIACIAVFCIDLSGAMQKLNRKVWDWLYKGVKYTDWEIPLIGCSLCVTWWSGIIYLLVTGFSLYMAAYVALIAFLTPVIKDVLLYVKDLLIYLVDKLYGLING